jgi:hypothetical protein
VLPPEPSRRKSRWIIDPEVREAGLYFEVRDGQVVSKSVLWVQDTTTKIIQASGQVIGPNHVKMSWEVLRTPSSTQPEWNVLEMDSTLGDGVIQCAETIRSYKTPGAAPYETSVFVGTLRPISKAESQAIRELKEKQGLTPRGTVETK